MPSTAALAMACLLALPMLSVAKDKDKNGSHGRDHRSSSNDHRSDRNDRDRHAYTSHPRSGFTLSLGTGYAGRGYYYGPPNSPYYYQRSDVRYYATRESVPRQYYSSSSYQYGATEIAVQRALARSGYYRGTIDGQIGPASRSAIAHYQQDHGMRRTGEITTSLLQSLRLR